MDRVDKYKRIEDDQQEGKGKAKVIPHEGFQIRPIQQQPAEKGLRRAIRVEQHPDHRCSLPRADASSIKKKSRMNPSSNGPTRWWEISKSETVTSIANIIGIMGIPQKIVEVCGITWTNLSEKAN